MSDQTPDRKPDWGEFYRGHVAAVCGLVGDLTAEQLASTVPATPEWTVHQVVAHLAGGRADGVAGRMDGAPGDAWTARHVAEREGVGVPDLLEEIRGTEDAVVASVREASTPAAAWDLAVHHADLHEALDLGVPPEHFWVPVVDVLAPAQAPGLVGAVAPYELFRGLFSRRSRAQMAAWGSDLDQEQLDAICIFGARDDDQPVPGPHGS